jgi:hypothetical protein
LLRSLLRITVEWQCEVRSGFLQKRKLDSLRTLLQDIHDVELVFGKYLMGMNSQGAEPGCRGERCRSASGCPEWVNSIRAQCAVNRVAFFLSSGAEFAPNWESALNIICEEREEGWQITVDAPELARVLSRFGLRDEAALNNPQQELPNPRN